MNKNLSIALLSAALAFVAGFAGTARAANLEIVDLPPNALQVPQATPRKSKSQTDIYIVQMRGDPVMSYTGGLQGYQATKPAVGEKLAAASTDVKKYAAYLESSQDRVMQSVGAQKVYSYRYGINGFAARMSKADAAALRSRNDIVNVWKDEILELHTNTSPRYIRLTQRGAAWSEGYVGEDIVIGIVDSGIWPEHPSFADVRTPKFGNRGPNRRYGPIPSSFTPSGCDFGNTAANGLDAPASCNKKLVAARCYNLGFSSALDPSNPCGGDGAFTLPTEFQSARDNDGHGSHVGSTAGGNFGVDAAIGGNFLGRTSGIAPRARIAAYKVCWNGTFPPAPFQGGCASSDSAAAIDQAVADGVDVINYSIGGASTVFAGADDIAFLFAADAGVYVATSNGNDGPGAETVGTPAGVPWITAVGATQDNGVFNLAITVNSPASIAGDKIAIEGNGDVLLADTGTITDAVTLTSPADGCAMLANPISGIALTIRGTCGFIDKYNNAAAAGASAIIVYNDGTTPDRVDPIAMAAPGATIPGVMVSFDDGDAMASESGVTATMDPNSQVLRKKRIAGFSSRGPNGGAPDVIKPDLSAPGVDILAAQTPIPNDGQPPNELFQIISGTSMASPHVAGSFAILKQAHPDWTPAQAKSALMTTSRKNLKKTFGETRADPFDIGAGEIRPTRALDPGLTYDAGFNDYLAFTCGNNVQLVSDASCSALEAAGFPSDGSDLNLPSIGIADLVGTQTITRTVTSVAKHGGKRSYYASVRKPKGVRVSVWPKVLRLRPGESASYEVTFTTKKNATLNEWAFGSLTWNHGYKYSVRSPIAVRPTSFSAPAEVDGTDDGAGNGSVSVPVSFGYNGAYTASVSGMDESLSAPGNVTATEEFDVICLDINIPSTHFRFATFDADTTTPGADDIDLRLFILDGSCTTGENIVQIGASGGATSEEVIDIPDAPVAGYLLVIDYFSAATGDNIDYVAWAQPVFGEAGNTAVNAPASAVSGTSDTVTVDYSGLATGRRHLGILTHEDDNGEIARTIIDVDAQ